MDGEISEESIEETLRLLSSTKDYERQAGAERLRHVKARPMDERILDRLKAMVDSDSNAAVRSAAAGTLETLAAPPVDLEQPGAAIPPAPISQATRRRHLLIGFAGWYLANGLLWLLITGGRSVIDPYLPNLVCLPFLANVLVPVVLGTIRRVRWIALGILAALALNFIVSLALGLLINGICFIPFFIK